MHIPWFSCQSKHRKINNR